MGDKASWGSTRHAEPGPKIEEIIRHHWEAYSRLAICAGEGMERVMLEVATGIILWHPERRMQHGQMHFTRSKISPLVDLEFCPVMGPT